MLEYWNNWAEFRKFWISTLLIVLKFDHNLSANFLVAFNSFYCSLLPAPLMDIAMYFCKTKPSAFNMHKEMDCFCKTDVNCTQIMNCK